MRISDWVQTCALPICLVGGSNIVLPGFAPDRAAAMLASGDANAVLLVPTMISMMVEYLRQHPADLSGVTDIFYGASPISDALLRDAMAAFPSARFYQGYGQRDRKSTRLNSSH